MKRDVDDILKRALTPEEEPDMRLNRKILNKAEEMTRMAKNKRKRGRIPAAVLAACITLAVGSMAVMAAWKYLSPTQIAEELSDKKLADAFSGKDSVPVNETQEYGGYKVTLLGAVSGKNIGDYLVTERDGSVRDDMFYAALAIERADGTPMPDTSDDAYNETPFFASTYIKGLDPRFYNMASMNGGYSEFVRDGVQYRLIELDNIEVFADRGIYIGVNSGRAYDYDAFLYDGDTGEIARNEAYEGVNALFVLPIDKSKGDPEAAEAFLKSLEEEKNNEEPIELSEEEQEVEAWVEAFEAELKEGRIKEDAQRIESTVQTYKPDADHTVTYSYDLGDEGAGGGVAFLDEMFPDKKPGSMGISGYSYSDRMLESLRLDVITLNEDGTVTFAVYEKRK